MVGGHIPIGFVLLPGALPQMRAGKLKALAVATDQRVSAAPNLPTMTEAGLPGLDLVGWGGILVPAGTPNEVILRLNQHISNVVRSQRFGNAGSSMAWSPGSQRAVSWRP